MLRHWQAQLFSLLLSLLCYTFYHFNSIDFRFSNRQKLSYISDFYAHNAQKKTACALLHTAFLYNPIFVNGYYYPFILSIFVYSYFTKCSCHLSIHPHQMIYHCSYHFRSYIHPTLPCIFLVFFQKDHLPLGFCPIKMPFF